MPFPPPIVLGGADCLANGARLPLSVVRSLPGGVDSRCYESGGQPVPAAPPGGMVCWFRPEELPAVADATPVNKWPDHGPYGNDATWDGTGSAPQYAAPIAGSLPALNFAIAWRLGWPYGLPLGSAFSVYFAWSSRSAFVSRAIGPALVAVPALNIGSPGFNQLRTSYLDSAGLTTFVESFSPAALTRSWCRRDKDALELGSTVWGTRNVAVDPNGVNDVKYLTSIGTGIQTSQFYYLHEALVYGWRLTDAEQAAVLAYLGSRPYRPLP